MENIKITTPCADVSRLKDHRNIVYIEFFDLDVPMSNVQEHLTQIYDTFVKDDQIVYCISVQKEGGKSLQKMSTDARKYLASDAIKKVFKASAIIVNNPFTRLLGNLYMTAGRPPIPTKLFKNQDQAIEWLLKN